MNTSGWKTRVQFFNEEDSHGCPIVWNFGGEDSKRSYIDSCMAEQYVAVLEAEVELGRLGHDVGVLVDAYDTWLEANDTEDPYYGP